MCRCHPLLFGFLARGHFPQMPQESRLSANDKDDNEMIPEAVYRSPGIYILRLRETSEILCLETDEGCANPN